MKLPPKTYLGDSVYCDVDRYSGDLVLTTENGYADDPRNRIVMDAAVFNALIEYATSVKLAIMSH